MARRLVLVILLLVAVGCAGEDGDEDAGAPGTGTFVAIDNDFEEAPDRLAAGEVTIELVNEGASEHNVVFEEAGDEPVVEAGSGETVEGTVTLEAGEHTAYCSVPGHREAGMETTVTVEG